MVTTLEKIRASKLDPQTEGLLMGFKKRSHYLLNSGIFTEEFCDGKTWFEYRLRAEQGLDSEFGRYVFQDQKPLLFKRSELTPARITRVAPETGIRDFGLDKSGEIINLYGRILPLICSPGEDRNSYGEATKIDVENALLLHERIFCTGMEVAASKLESEPDLIYLSGKVLRDRLTNPERERKVLNRARELAELYCLPNPNAIREVFEEIIKLTLDVEVEYISSVQRSGSVEQKPLRPVGWGQELRTHATRSQIGFGR